MTKLGFLKSGMEYSCSLEFSFAAWLCGDGAYIAPCSKVAKIHANQVIKVSVCMSTSLKVAILVTNFKIMLRFAFNYVHGIQYFTVMLNHYVGCSYA